MIAFSIDLIIDISSLRLRHFIFHFHYLLIIDIFTITLPLR